MGSLLYIYNIKQKLKEAFLTDLFLFFIIFFHLKRISHLYTNFNETLVYKRRAIIPKFEHLKYSSFNRVFKLLIYAITVKFVRSLD